MPKINDGWWRSSHKLLSLDDAWCYAETDGISVYLGTKGMTGKIPVATIRAYIRRIEAQEETNG